ncbi:MAG: PEP-CTERM sorting domain-containing protein [Pirellulales bacterium]
MQSVRHRVTASSVAVALIALVTGQAFAAFINLTPAGPGPDTDGSVVLADLISGEVEGITVGDKHFDNFSYFSTVDMPIAANVNVIGIIDADGNYGLRFQGGFKDLFDPGGESSDSLIGFDVSVANPQTHLISDVHLFGNPSLSGSGSLNAFAEVVETISGAFGDAQLRIQNDLNGLINAAWIDPLPFPVATLHVIKDIQLFSTDGVRATISFVDQTFSQVVIPEPSSMALLCVVFVAIGWVGTRSRRVG